MENLMNVVGTVYSQCMGVMSFNFACAGPCLRVYPWLLVAVWHNRGRMLEYNSHCSYMYMIHLLYIRSRNRGARGPGPPNILGGGAWPTQ